MADNQYGDVSLNLNGYKINGLTSLSFGMSQSMPIVKGVGTKSRRREALVPGQGSIKYSQYAFFNDPFFAYATGGQLVSGGIYRNNYSTLFKSGLIDNYSLSCAVGDFPSTSINILTLGDVYTGKPNYYPFGYNAYPNPSIVRPKDIEISGFSTGNNYPKSFTYSLSIENELLYYTNKWGVGDYKIRDPIGVTISVTIDSIDYRTSGFHNYLTEKELKNINIILNSCNGDKSIYPMVSGVLVNETYSIRVGGQEEVTLDYEGFINV